MAEFNASKEIAKILDEYGEGITEKFDEMCKTTAKECADEMKNASQIFVNNGDYAENWAVKKTKRDYVVWNKKRWMLTHLLENGHIVDNQYGTGWGRFPGKKHIEPVAQKFTEQLYNECTKEFEG